jgi:hypothetical protein
MVSRPLNTALGHSGACYGAFGVFPNRAAKGSADGGDVAFEVGFESLASRANRSTVDVIGKQT